MPHPKILISLVNWYRYQDTIACIRSLKKLDYPNFTVSIVDNDSPNDSFEKLNKMFPELHIVKALKNDGYAAGHKINVEYAKAIGVQAVWILNSDLEVRPEALSELVNAWNTNGRNIYGSITLSSENPDIVDFGGGINPKENTRELVYNQYRGVLYSELPAEEIREVQTVEGSSIFIPMYILTEFGFMKRDFFMYAEETDYCYRLRMKGIKSFVVKKSIVVHKHGASFQSETKDLSWIAAYYRRRNFMRFLIEHYGWTKKEILNKNYTTSERLKFKLKCLNPKFKKANWKAYWLLKGTEHAVNGITGKTIDPKLYL
jgi:GT2 family glycosyltransferase